MLNKVSISFAIVLLFIGFYLGGGKVWSSTSTFADMIERVDDGIVLIESSKKKLDEDGKPISGLGTGFFIGDNLIATAAHVVSDTNTITVSMETSPQDYEAEIVNLDKVADVALLRIKDYEKFAEQNEPVSLSFADHARRGETVFAFGHPYGKIFTVTRGTVSSVGRKEDATPRYMIQTDAQVLQGNSGGPLLNSKGEVIGINDMIMPVQGGTFAYAIPYDLIAKYMDDWKRYGEIRWTSIGFAMERNRITGIVPDSPAEQAGLKTGDLIQSIAIDGEVYDTNRAVDIVNLLAKSNYESEIIFTVTDDTGDVMEIPVDATFKKSDVYLNDLQELLNTE